MNFTVPLLLLPTLSLLYGDVSYVIKNLHKKGRMVQVKFINCTAYELLDQVIHLMASYDIPVTISTHLDNTPEYPDNNLEFIISDEFHKDVVNPNKYNPRIFLFLSKGAFSPSMDHINGRVLFLFQKTQEIFCKNPLVGSHWIEGNITQCQWTTRRNTNPRRISVFMETDIYSHVERLNNGNFIMVGFKGSLMAELRRYFNVNLKYVLPKNVIFHPHFPIKSLKPLRGINMGRMNTTLTVAEDNNV